MLCQCRSSANSKAWLFFLKRPFSSRNSFHALERSTLIPKLSKIFFRPNGNISVQAVLLQQRSFATSSDENNAPGSDGHQGTIAQNLTRSDPRVAKIESVNRKIDDRPNQETNDEFVDRTEEILNYEKSGVEVILGKCIMVFFQIIAGAFIGIVLYLLYTAVQKSYEDPLDDPLKVLEGEYGSYLAKKSYPFEDFIEKLLQSGTVKRIIHFPPFKRAVVVLSSGIDIEGLPADKQVIPLNVFGHRTIHSSASLTQEIRRFESKLGILPSNGVPIEVIGPDEDIQWQRVPIFVFTFGILPFFIFLKWRKIFGRKKPWKPTLPSSKVKKLVS
ncbi:hypothetical protein DdX_13729 [Ditylenchus destructor]|uniref:Uncharacterized protein n=1 Tax=Ditylenchus destructor TaxID=166010 RepID=A0AAD4MSE3_9BILA|nr:hypothetical protein DdX_13729 [Ditylenchus destructor]